MSSFAARLRCSTLGAAQRLRCSTLGVAAFVRYTSFLNEAQLPLERCATRRMRHAKIHTVLLVSYAASATYKSRPRDAHPGLFSILGKLETAWRGSDVDEAGPRSSQEQSGCGPCSR